MNNIIPKITLNDGLALPSVGLGTYSLKGAEGVNSIQYAIHLGYRFIDSANNYENEGTVGEAVRRSSIPREELIISSKLSGRDHTYARAVTAIQESLYRTNLDYFDLFYIHWPNPQKNNYVEAWQALIDAKKWGLIRSIGVCNFLPEYIERIVKETGVKPSVNQVELHPFFNQEVQRKWHEEHDILTVAWSPLSRGKDIFQNDTIRQIANYHQKSVSQIVLRWHYQLGTIPIPKSASHSRQLENISIFDFQLSENEMKMILGLTSSDGRIYNNQQPAIFEEF